MGKNVFVFGHQFPSDIFRALQYQLLVYSLRIQFQLILLKSGRRAKRSIAKNRLQNVTAKRKKNRNDNQRCSQKQVKNDCSLNLNTIGLLLFSVPQTRLQYFVRLFAFFSHYSSPTKNIGKNSVEQIREHNSATWRFLCRFHIQSTLTAHKLWP